MARASFYIQARRGRFIQDISKIFDKFTFSSDVTSLTAGFFDADAIFDYASEVRFGMASHII